MATINLDPATKTVSAALTDQEFIVVASSLATIEGQQGLISMISSYLEQAYRVKMEQDRHKIKQFAETATDEQRAAMMAIVNAPPA